MQLNTYLHFGDNCREAFEFYRLVFGGEFTWIVTFADGPTDMPPVPDNEKDPDHARFPPNWGFGADG